MADTAPSQWKVVYDQWRKALSPNGVTNQNANGPLPKTRAADPIRMLAQIHPHVIDALKKAARVDRAMIASFPQSLYSGSAEVVPGMNGATATITAVDWLIAAPTKANAQLRTTPKGIVYRLGGTDVGTKTAVDGIAHAWDEAIAIAGASFAMAPMAPWLTDASVKSWWVKFGGLLAAVEIFGDIPPPPDTWETIKQIASEVPDSTKVVVKQVAAGAGAAVGFVAQTAGEAAGTAAAGFFDTAGLEAMMAVAAGAYLYFVVL